MKKLLLIILAVLLLAGLVACGKEPHQPASSAPESAPTEPTESGTSGSDSSENDPSSPDTPATAPTTGKTTAPQEEHPGEVDWGDLFDDPTTAGQTTATTAKNTPAGKTTTAGKTTVPGKTTTAGKTTLPTTVADTTRITTATTLPTQETSDVEGVELPKAGYSPDGKIEISKVELKGNTVSFTVKNTTTGRETDRDDYFTYACADKNGKVLKYDNMIFGRIHAKQSKVCTVTLPEGTAKLTFTDFSVNYWTDGFH